MPVRDAGNIPTVLVPCAADEPAVCCELPVSKRGAAGRNEFFHGMHSGKINLPLGIGIIEQMHMRIAKTRGHGVPAKVNHFCCGREGSTGFLFRADGNNAAIPDGQRGNEGGCCIQRVDVSVYIEFLHNSVLSDQRCIVIILRFGKKHNHAWRAQGEDGIMKPKTKGREAA